jgi:hypothetical protein
MIEAKLKLIKHPATPSVKTIWEVQDVLKAWIKEQK